MIEAIEAVQSKQQEENESCRLTFKPFWDHLMADVNENKGVTSLISTYLLEQLDHHPEWLTDIPQDSVEEYHSLFRLVQEYMSPPVEKKDTLLWGLAHPSFKSLIYGTDPLWHLLNQQLSLVSDFAACPDRKASLELHRVTTLYSFLLHKFYGYTSSLTKNLSFKYQEEETGLLKFFKLHLDDRFFKVEIQTPLPELDMVELQKQVLNGSVLQYLQEILPLSLFQFQGFIVLNATDVTVSCIEEEIRTSIIELDSDTYLDTAKHVLKLLPSLVGSNFLKFGLMPFLELNNKLVDFESGFSICLFMDAIKEKNCSSVEAFQYLEAFRKDPQLVIIQANDNLVAEPFLSSIQKGGDVEAFALLPIYRDKHLIGILEIIALADSELLNYKDLVLLEGAMPSLAELLNRSIHEFQYYLNKVIREKFTSIKPAIEWKVNEVAWKHLQGFFNNHPQEGFEALVFEEVYPLYGAIDIRDSTIKRNLALREDLTVLFTRLLETLQELKKYVKLLSLDEKIEEANRWILCLTSFLDTSNEANIHHFIEEEIYPFFAYLKEYFPGTKEEIEAYHHFIDPKNGAVFSNRNDLEKSFQAVNSRISREVAGLETTLLQYYPCYFESFRTDGVEYDVYVGQSISPKMPFDLLYLREFRLHQLIFMAKVVRITSSLVPQLAVPLETTQLIFVNDRAIDISFREDEKRFDVEGAYNIRYQMVKKRIDKVHIKDTGERLTQPNKIAIVYFNREVEPEYNRHIAYLQNQGYLTDAVEYLDLEELQGVSGLKAIRVSVLQEEVVSE